MPRDGLPSQPTAQSTDQPASRAVSQSTLQAAPQPVSQSVSQSVSHSGNILQGHAANLATLTAQLKELVARETELLQSHKTQEAAKLNGEKQRLMAMYRDTLNKVQVNQHQLGDTDSKARTALRSITDDFRETLRDHARVVLRMKAVTEGLVKSVSEEVKKTPQACDRLWRQCCLCSTDKYASYIA